MSCCVQRWCVLGWLVHLVLLAGNGWAEEAGEAYGDFKGRVNVVGEVPVLKPLIEAGDATVKDAAVCASKEVLDPSLVVDAATKGVANVAVYLRVAPKGIHPDLVKPREKDVEFRVKGCQYEPHIVFARVGEKIRIKCEDRLAHNTHTYSLSRQACYVVRPFDLEGEVHEMRFAEKFPFKVGCDIHPWMQGYWLVLDHPYAAITGKDGSFQIKNLPVGEHSFIVWHERCGYVERERKVTIKAAAATEVAITIPAAKLAAEK